MLCAALNLCCNLKNLVLLSWAMSFRWQKFLQIASNLLTRLIGSTDRAMLHTGIASILWRRKTELPRERGGERKCVTLRQRGLFIRNLAFDCQVTWLETINKQPACIVTWHVTEHFSC